MQLDFEEVLGMAYENIQAEAKEGAYGVKPILIPQKSSTMKLILSLLLITSLAVSVRGQTDSSNILWDTAHFDFGETTMTQTNGHGTDLARKVGTNGKWTILQPDSLMAYYERERWDLSMKNAQLTREYNKLIDDYNRLLKNFKLVSKAYIDQTRETKEAILKILALNKK